MEPTIFWGECLRMARCERKLTQQQVSDAIGISRQTYSSYETGRSHPSPELIAIFSEIYDINLFEYILQNLPEDYRASTLEFKQSLLKKSTELMSETKENKDVKKAKATLKKDTNIKFKANQYDTVSASDKKAASNRKKSNIRKKRIKIIAENKQLPIINPEAPDKKDESEDVLA